MLQSRPSSATCGTRSASVPDRCTAHPAHVIMSRCMHHWPGTAPLPRRLPEDSLSSDFRGAAWREAVRARAELLPTATKALACAAQHSAATTAVAFIVKEVWTLNRLSTPLVMYSDFQCCWLLLRASTHRCELAQ
jgi:hypothetical protein